MFTLMTLVALFACTSTEKDTGDTGVVDTDTTDTDTDAEIAFAMTGDTTGEGFSGDCADGLCIYRITTTTAAGGLDLDMTETADLEFLYNEGHTAFDLETTNADGSETYRLDLDWVTTLDAVVLNETTLFNPNTGATADRTTWFFGAVSADMAEGDCRVTGHDTAYYSDWCTNVAR
jgi:hypothetical protein